MAEPKPGLFADLFRQLAGNRAIHVSNVPIKPEVEGLMHRQATDFDQKVLRVTPELVFGGVPAKASLNSIAGPGPGAAAIPAYTAAQNAIRLLEDLKQDQANRMREMLSNVQSELDQIVTPVTSEQLSIEDEKKLFDDLKTNHLHALTAERDAQLALFDQKWPAIWHELQASGLYVVADETQLKANYKQAITAEFTAKETAAQQYYQAQDAVYKTAKNKTFEKALVTSLFDELGLTLPPGAVPPALAMAAVVGAPDNDAITTAKSEMILDLAARGELKFPHTGIGNWWLDSLVIVDNELRFKPEHITEENAPILLKLLALHKLKNGGDPNSITLKLHSKDPTSDEKKGMQLLAKLARINGLTVNTDEKLTDKDAVDIYKAKKALGSTLERESKGNIEYAKNVATLFSSLNVKKSHIERLTLAIERTAHKISEIHAKPIATRVAADEQQLATALQDHARLTDELIAVYTSYVTTLQQLPTAPGFQFAQLTPDQKGSFVREEERHVRTAVECMERMVGTPAGAPVAAPGCLAQAQANINAENTPAHVGPLPVALANIWNDAKHQPAEFANQIAMLQGLQGVALNAQTVLNAPGPGGHRAAAAGHILTPRPY
jgi:hypothetical protein